MTEVINLIERKGRSCMVEGDKELITELIEAELDLQTRALKYQQTTKKPKEIAELKEIREVLGYDPTTEKVKDLKYLLKVLEPVSVCVGTEATLPMQEEDYPLGELGGWQKVIYAKGK